LVLSLPTRRPEVTQNTNYEHFRTHKALVDLDMMTGRKSINQYEVIEELGRGVHGKVKLARNTETGENVAIKIIPRFSKKRRLGKVTASPQDKTKREIAILKKIRHPNIVALLEIIDDPELKKIYVVLEHVELGEVVWRKKGLPFICHWERRLVERGMHGEQSSFDEDEGERYLQLLERRQALNHIKRTKMQETQRGADDFWSLEHGAAHEDEFDVLARSLGRDGDNTAQPSTAVPSASHPGSRAPSMTRSLSRSAISGSRTNTPLPSECDVSSVDVDAESEMETPGPLRSYPGSSTALDGTMYGAYVEDPMYRGRSPSMADSIISHMSSIDFSSQPHDPFSDDFSYVPCFTIKEARATFRDTVLGLEYLHYEGVVHRDIKPANLLWTKDHRVKISDFGVSYFGRPIREGEPDDEPVSESEARDFDDDLELAKTVGTPAFFAPELCYTDVDHEQPKISEQIDVWSLGVTLYCLIFARIPFMAEDEFQMFKKIAKEEVYIPRRRLRPVDPHHSPVSTSFYKRASSEPYRDDNVLAYEEVDDDLYDLLRKMLIKNPEKRIRLRDVKRHPWVVADIDVPVIQWIDDTDPSRRFSGRKIEVDEKDITRAVVPLTLLERARSAVKKAVGKVIHGRTEKSESQSQTRRRATSSVASSAGELPLNATSFPLLRDMRRRSIRPDDYFAAVRESDHPLSQSVSATPRDSPTEDGPGSPQQRSTPAGGDLGNIGNDSASIFDTLPGLGAPLSSSTSLSSGRGLILQRHGRVKSVSNAQIALAHAKEAHTMPASPAAENSVTDDPVASLRKARDVRSQDDATRSRSVDRGLFANEDKRAEPMVAVSTAVAPGSIELPRRPLSVDPVRAMYRPSLASPVLFAPTAIRTYQHGYPNSDPNMHEKHFSDAELDRRPMTSHRVVPTEGNTSASRVYHSSAAESFTRAQEQLIRRQVREAEKLTKRDGIVTSQMTSAIPSSLSLDSELPLQGQQPTSRADTTSTLAISASTSPSAVASPICIENLPQQQSFRSDPSLPALLSGASSVSADAEGDFLLKPGLVDRPSLLDTTESLTPPALGKEPIEGFPITVDDQYQTLLVSQKPHEVTTSAISSTNVVEDDEDSDSDGGLTMAKSRRRAFAKAHPKRRDTQTSITSTGSTETAKKVFTTEPADR
jgi:[calcium/calmodulin-dependent protein kinase] kinase